MSDVPPFDRVLPSLQLDLFLDSGDTVLIHDVVTGIAGRDARGTDAALARLRQEYPAHPDLPALALLASASLAWLPSAVTHATLTATIDTMERSIVPVARRFLGADAPSFLRPLWRSLGAAAQRLPFDETYPHAHAGWLGQQSGDWDAVRDAVGAEPDRAAKPLLGHWLALAHHHLGEVDTAVTLWLPLCWTAPAFFARVAPTLPSTRLRDAWEAFERALPLDNSLADVMEPAIWFPAWLLLRERSLVRLFRPDEIPDTHTAVAVFRLLLSLVPLEGQGLGEAVIAHRRALRRLSPDFLGYYLDVVGGRRRRP